MFDRLKEASTMSGIGLVALTASQQFGFGVPEQVANAATQVADNVANQNWVGAGLAALFGLASIFMKEQAK
jgi:hypothetical protein